MNSAPSSVTAWRNAVFVVFTVNGLGMAAWISRIPALRDQLDIPVSQVGILLFAISTGAILGLLISGHLVHAIGGAQTIRVTLLAFGLGLILTGVATTVLSNFLLALLGMAITGFAGAVCDVVDAVSATTSTSGSWSSGSSWSGSSGASTSAGGYTCTKTGACAFSEWAEQDCFCANQVNEAGCNVWIEGGYDCQWSSGSGWSSPTPFPTAAPATTDCAESSDCPSSTGNCGCSFFTSQSTCEDYGTTSSWCQWTGGSGRRLATAEATIVTLNGCPGGLSYVIVIVDFLAALLIQIFAYGLCCCVKNEAATATVTTVVVVPAAGGKVAAP